MNTLKSNCSGFKWCHAYLILRASHMQLTSCTGCITLPMCNSLPVGVASSNELEVSGDGFPVQPVVTHDLLDQTNGICCICFIKEHHCVQVVLPVHQRLLLGLLNKPRDVRLCDASMYLCACVGTCMCVYMYVCMHVYVHICALSCMYVHTSGTRLGGRRDQYWNGN